MKEKIKKSSTVYQRLQSAYKAMLSSCLECRNNTESKTQKLQIQIKEKQCFYQKSAMCNSGKLRFIKN